MNSSDLLNFQQEQLSIFFNNLNAKKVEDVVELINLTIQNSGNVLLCGVGKSGNVAKHLATVLTSVGVPSIQIDPIDALHGDIGIATEKDLLILLSKSGNTAELRRLAPYVKKRGTTILGMFCNSKANLLEYCDHFLEIPCGKELDNNFDLVPTTSIVCFILVGNILISRLIHLRKLSLDQYGLNHPCGNIGKKLLMQVKDILDPTKFLKVLSTTTISDCLVEMCGKKTGYAMVINDENNSRDSGLLGIITEGDVRRHLVK